MFQLPEIISLTEDVFCREIERCVAEVKLLNVKKKTVQEIHYCSFIVISDV